MKVSPVQLAHVAFRRVYVEVDIEHMDPPSPEGFDAHAMFDGVMVKTEVSTTRLDDNDRRGIPYFLTLRVVVDNAPDPDNPDQKFSPYKIDVEVGGGVIVAHGAEHLGNPEDLASVNGTSLLWGAVREQVAGLTSRMVVGTALLPSVHFQDLRKEAQNKALVHDNAAKPKRSRAKKS